MIQTYHQTGYLAYSYNTTGYTTYQQGTDYITTSANYRTFYTNTGASYEAAWETEFAGTPAPVSK